MQLKNYFILTIITTLIGKITYSDYAESWQLLFQDPATPIMEGIINLHHDIMFILIIIAVLVAWMLYRCIALFTNNKTPQDFTHGETIEIIWTITPSLILMIIGVPSFTLLYSMDEVIDPSVTIKAIGHQWYWSYEYSDYISNDGEPIAFDSYMLPEEDLKPGGLRLLEVDNKVIVPVNTHIRILVTAADVLHCWAVPSLGVKIDATPGRLNQLSMFIKREGTFYGQCSEICGINHAFMPICVEAVKLDKYLNWITEQ